MRQAWVPGAQSADGADYADGRRGREEHRPEETVLGLLGATALSADGADGADYADGGTGEGLADRDVGGSEEGCETTGAPWGREAAALLWEAQRPEEAVLELVMGIVGREGHGHRPEEAVLELLTGIVERQGAPSVGIEGSW